ncbi:hypothetical protein RND81_08G105200 [Saponaria officinalis]|uniref:Uncharacterized protein n=1 Tax=Saponaria officinalis TaxID=3572 RepID=A0AAW1J7K0_SAPOF
MNARQSAQKTRSVNTFSVLSNWVPDIYVHPTDHICSEFIGYFQHRERMKKLGVWRQNIQLGV